MKPRQDATPLPKITFLTQDEVRRLLAVITGKRDRALFQLAYHHWCTCATRPSPAIPKRGSSLPVIVWFE